MAKVFSDGILHVGFWADEDLSAKQYYCVKTASTADYVKTANGASDPGPLGVLQDDNAASVGQEVAVKLFGFTKAVVAACDLAGNTCSVGYNAWLTCGSDGKLYKTGGCALSNARAYGTVTSGSVIMQVFFSGNTAACTGAAS